MLRWDIEKAVVRGVPDQDEPEVYSGPILNLKHGCFDFEASFGENEDPEHDPCGVEIVFLLLK